MCQNKCIFRDNKGLSGVEDEVSMEKWWLENFGKQKLKFVGHACVTTTKENYPRYRICEEEYGESEWLGSPCQNILDDGIGCGNNIEPYKMGTMGVATRRYTRRTRNVQWN